MDDLNITRVGNQSGGKQTLHDEVNRAAGCSWRMLSVSVVGPMGQMVQAYVARLYPTAYRASFIVWDVTIY